MGEINGLAASIKWHYFEAARIDGYSLHRDPLTRRWSVTGEIVSFDPFKLSQSPLRLVVPHKHGQWIWPIVSAIPRRTGQFSAALGPIIPKAPVNVYVDPQTGIRTPPAK
jgi:hypothetical protein